MRRNNILLVAVLSLCVGASLIPVWGIHLSLVLASSFTAVLILRSSWRIGKVKAWRWAALGSSFWALEELTWMIVRLSGIQSFYPTDIFYFAGALAWLIALLQMPSRVLPRANLVITLPVWGLIVWLFIQGLEQMFFPFILSDLILLVAAFPLIESAFKSRAHEGRILLGFGFYVKALASTLYGWLSSTTDISQAFFLLVIFAYLFIGLGAWLELRRSRGTLIPAVSTLLGLEAVVGTVLFMLYQANDLSASVFTGIAIVLGYLLFFGIMVLLLTDRRSKLRAQNRLKNYRGLLEKLLAFESTKLSIDGLIDTLLNDLKPSFPSLQGLELSSDIKLTKGVAKGYAFPLVIDGNSLGHLYFKKQPENSDLLDALSPLLANQIKNTLAHVSFQNQAITDPLTELLNRRGLDMKSQDLLERAMRDKTTLSLAILDLDHFKRVNDHFGHDVGDKALVALANILKRMLRQHDLAVRWGGEEFLLLLYESDTKVAEEVIRRIRTELRSSVIPPISWPLTLSAGITGGHLESKRQLSQWISEADQALLKAKTNGRDRIDVAA